MPAAQDLFIDHRPAASPPGAHVRAAYPAHVFAHVFEFVCGEDTHA